VLALVQAQVLVLVLVQAQVLALVLQLQPQQGFRLLEATIK
jgi:hypothetical protein